MGGTKSNSSIAAFVSILRVSLQSNINELVDTFCEKLSVFLDIKRTSYTYENNKIVEERDIRIFNSYL